jgi:hypothetical protein
MQKIGNKHPKKSKDLYPSANPGSGFTRQHKKIKPRRGNFVKAFKEN